MRFIKSRIVRWAEHIMHGQDEGWLQKFGLEEIIFPFNIPTKFS
jgi:hypothetical protein